MLFSISWHCRQALNKQRKLIKRFQNAQCSYILPPLILVPIAFILKTYCDCSRDGQYILTCSNGFNGKGCEATVSDFCFMLSLMKHYCSLRACTVSYLNENDILKMNLYVDHKECPLMRGKNSCSVGIWLGPLLSIHLQEESTYGSCLSARFNWILKFRQQVELLSELNWRCSFLLVVKLDWDYCIVFLGRTVLLSRWPLYKNYYCYYYDYY